MKLTKSIHNFILLSTTTICLFLSTNVLAVIESDKEPLTQYLFVQTAQLGELHYDEKNKYYNLSLHKVDSWIIYFSNVPKRVTGFTETDKFTDEFNKNIAEKNPKGLNSGIVAFDIKNKKMIRYTFSLTDAKYDKINNSTQYIAHILPGEQESFHSDIVFEHAAIFIDSCASCGGSNF